MAHERAITITTGELSTLLGAELIGPGTVVVSHVEAVDRAGPGALTFIRSLRYAKEWPVSKGSAAIVSRDIPVGDLLPTVEGGSRALLVVPDADLAVIKVLELFAARPVAPKPGVHPQAFVDPAATVAASASIGPFCTVSAGASVGEGSVLVGSVFLGQDARVGDRCTIHPNVSILERCIVGNSCILHSGVAIGADGFGYRPSPDGRGVVKIPHIGNVVLGDHVEIGANTCIDRAKFGATSVGNGTKIDNLVQVGHGVRIGRSTIICGHVALAGSITIGDGVVIAGMVAIVDNAEIGDGAKIGACSGVNGNVPAGATYMGAPAGPAGEWRRTYAALRRMGKRPQRGDRTP